MPTPHPRTASNERQDTFGLASRIHDSLMSDAASLEATLSPPSRPFARGMAAYALTKEGYLLEGIVKDFIHGGIEILFNSRMRQHVKESFFAFERVAHADEKVAVIMEAGRNIDGQGGRHFRIDRSTYPGEHFPAHLWPYESYCVELKPGILLQGASKSPGVLRFLDQLPLKNTSSPMLPKKGIEFSLPEAHRGETRSHDLKRATFARNLSIQF